MKSGKAAGKGRRKGKGKGGGRGGGERQQMRRELASVVGEVLRSGGAAEGQGPGKGAGKGKRKGSGAGTPGPWAPSRRAQRKGKRQERKERRTHFFGGGRRRVPEGPEPAEKAKRPAEGGAAKPAAVKRKRRRVDDDDDDEEIASSEAEGPGSGGRKGKAKRGKKGEAEEYEDHNSELGASGEEGEDAEEEEGEADDPAEDSEEEEEAQDGRVARRAPAGASAGGGAYTPPHLRAAGDRGAAASKAAEQLRRRQLRGLMNRVSEGNLDPSAQELAKVLGEMLPEVGSTSAADAFLSVLLPAAVGDPSGSVLVLGCHAALAVTAHLLFGAAFGAAALLQAGDWLSRRLPLAEEAREATGEDARVAKNCVVFVCLMFSFGLLPGSAIFDLARYIFANVSELRIELALTLLRYAGRSLRADCAEDFREVLRFVNETASGSQAALAVSQESSDMRTRVDFLLRELSDLKNNKTSFAAMDRFEHVRSWLRSSTLVAAKKIADHQLAVPFRFMQDAPPVGWPLGGSAAAAGPRMVGRGTAAAKSAQDPLRAVAQAQRLTTELRQSLFVALMGAEDFEHAAERLALVAASAKAGPDEACLILFHCAVREKVPNPFYEHVASALCARPQPWGRRFAHCLKRAAVQNLQQAHAFGLRATVGLAELVAALVAAPGVKVPLAVLRFVRFGEAAPGGGPPGGVLGLLLRHLSESLLRRAVDADAAAEAFGALRRYDEVREGMLLVLDGLVRPRLPGRAQAPELHQKLKVARQELAKGAVEKPAKAAKASPRFL